MKATEKVEYKDRGDLTQVSTKDELQSEIMKENSDMFNLEHSCHLLEGDVCYQLGMSGEVVLADEIFSNQENLEE